MAQSYRTEILFGLLAACVVGAVGYGLSLSDRVPEYRPEALRGCGELVFEGIEVELWGIEIAEAHCADANALLQAELVEADRDFQLRRGGCWIEGTATDLAWTCEDPSFDAPEPGPIAGARVLAVPWSSGVDGPWSPQQRLLAEGLAELSRGCEQALDDAKAAPETQAYPEVCGTFWAWRCERHVDPGTRSRCQLRHVDPNQPD